MGMKMLYTGALLGVITLMPLRAAQGQRAPAVEAAPRDAEAESRASESVSSHGLRAVREEDRADRPFAPASGPRAERGVVVETDLVTMRAEQARAAALDAMRDDAVREAAIASARQEAPFDLTWGL
jgi:hypothetical protein